MRRPRVMKSIEIEARTVEEAITEALQKLETDLNQVDVTVLDEGNRGFLGILGSKQAKVRVDKKQPDHEVKMQKAMAFAQELLEKMDIPAEVAGTADEESVNLKIEGDDLGILIGRRGQ